MSDLAEFHQDILDEHKDSIIDILAEFFQGAFDDDPAAVADWLVQGGTSPDTFVHLVVALRRSLSPSKGADTGGASNG